MVKQGKGWFCEYDQQIYMSMVRRYVMLAKCVDASGDCLLSVFNEQVCKRLQRTRLQGLYTRVCSPCSELLLDAPAGAQKIVSGMGMHLACRDTVKACGCVGTPCT